MDPEIVHSAPSIEEDDWDTDGFVIPSLPVEDSDISKQDEEPVKNSEPSSVKVVKEEEKIYLGPHGGKTQPLNAGSRKQRFKQKLKEADWKFTGSGRENKVENLKQLVGSSKQTVSMPRGSPREWLDPHCHESQFERSYSH